MGPRDQTLDIIFIGQSLLAPAIPTTLEIAVTAMGGARQVEAQTIDCAPVIYNGGHSAHVGAGHARRPRRTGKFEIGVIDEAVPLLKHLTRGYV